MTEVSNLPLRRHVNVAFGVAVVALALIGGVSLWSARRSTEAAQERRQSFVRRFEIRRLLSAIQSAEARQRGYLLTDNSAFLAPHRAAVDSLPGQLARVHELVRERPAQAQRLRRLDPLMRERLAALDQTIALQRQGRAGEALRIVETGRGKALMDEIGAGFVEMEDEENRVLEEWETRLRAADRMRLLTGAGGSLLAVLLLTLAVVAINRNISERLRIEGALRNSERKQAQDKLHGSEERFHALVDGVKDYAIILLEPDGRIASWNAGAERIKGYAADEIIGKSVATFYTPEDIAAGLPQQNLERAAREGRYETEGLRVRKDGSRFWANAVISTLHDPAGRLQGFAKVTRDTTERRRLEDQLRQAQKMEAVGRLAGGVAHDFNNLLTAIFGYADLLAEELSPEHPGRSDLAEIRTAATRAAALTRQLLAFSRQQVLQPVVLNVNDVVANLEKMLHRVLGEDVELEAHLAPNVGNAKVDPGQLEQVILNLAVNARDAMPTGGKLTIETANAELGPEYAEAHRPVVPGPYIMLAVSDTGTGMDEATKARIFEPFFTTKEAGKGTGLGLATVYGIVKQSGGYVWVYSEPQHGATFKVYLPQLDAPAEALLPAKEPARAPAGGETVLLAEDDELLRPLARTVLVKTGYNVLEARSAAEALALARQHAGEIHLLISDVVMPGESGLQLARQLMAEHPRMRVLYMSGYTDEAVVRHGLLETGTNFLQKPFTPAILAAKVREVLDAPGPGPR